MQVWFFKNKKVTYLTQQHKTPMNDLYNYVFWYNSFESLWYAIPTKDYTTFFSGARQKQDLLTQKIIIGSDINDLINLLNSAAND